MSDIPNPIPDFSASGAVEYRPAETATGQGLENLLSSEQARLFAVPGVVSMGIGLGPAGGEALVIGVIDAGVAKRLPREINGVPVVVTVTGEVDAQPLP